MQFLKKNLGLILVLGFCYWAIRSLLPSGFFPIHDNEQLARLFDLNQALMAWDIPPRIAPNLGFGYGYPFFNFYPPLVYYIAEIFKLIGFSYISSIKLMIGAGFILAAFFMYLLSKEFFGKLGGLISAVVYTYAPYHAVDVYVRGALPEFWSMVFLPLIFWSFYKLSKDYKWKYVLISVISVSFLILSHNLVMVMAGPFLLIFVIFIGFTGKNKLRHILTSFASLIFAFLTTAYFWIPSFFEKGYTMVNLLTEELANYGQHFVCLPQFWNSPWGYGGSVSGCIADGMSFQIGKIQILLFLLSILIAIGLLLAKKTRTTGAILFIFLASLLFSVLMSTSYSQFIWDRISLLWYIQFPWRFLIFTSFFSSILAGSFVLIPVSNRIKYAFALLILSGAVFINAKYFVPSKFLLNVKDSDYVSRENIRWDASIISWEYVPKGVATKESDIKTTVIDITENDIAKQSFKVLSGDMVVRELENLPQEKKYLVMSGKQSVFRLNTYSFPGWKVYVDGNEVAYTDNNSLKLITLSPLYGAHVIVAEFTDTPIRFWSNLISLVSIFSLLIYSLLNIIKNKYEKKR
jgi:hypothetical protein